MLDFIVSSQRKGYTPTVREIMRSFGYCSPNSVHQHLRLMQKKGYVLLPSPRTSRSVQVLDSGTAHTLWGDFPV